MNRLAEICIKPGSTLIITGCIRNAKIKPEIGSTLILNNGGKIEKHHIDPKYMGGDSRGELIELDAAYHQMITNEFRRLQPYKTIRLDDATRHSIMRQVYMKYPLPY